MTYLLPALLSVAFAANPVGSDSVNVIVAWKQDRTEVALRKIEYAGLKIDRAVGTRAVCIAAPSRIRFAEELRHEPEIQSVIIDRPCEVFVVTWRRAAGVDMDVVLRTAGAQTLHQSKTLPFAVCKGPLLAQVQETLACIAEIESIDAVPNAKEPAK
jgi:hypothetical protein